MDSITKKCGVCGEVKSVSEFYWHNADNTYRYLCKKCSKESVKESRERNWKEPEFPHKSKIWRKQNPDFKPQPKPRKREEPKFPHKSKIWREAHPEFKPKTSTEQVAEWRKNNPEKFSKKRLVEKQRRRARIAGGGGSFTAAEWTSLCEQYGNKCLCCGEAKKLTADHVIPIVKGGTSNIDNIQPLCGSCNSRKGTSEIDFRIALYAP